MRLILIPGAYWSGGVLKNYSLTSAPDYLWLPFLADDFLLRYFFFFSLTLNPIRRRGGSGSSGGAMSWRIASKTTRNWSSYLFSIFASFRARSAWDFSNCRRRTKARMISMLTRTALGLFKTLESMATPCSVKAYGWYRRPPHWLEVPKWNLKLSNSCFLSWNIKSLGNRTIFLLTALINSPR